MFFFRIDTCSEKKALIFPTKTVSKYFLFHSKTSLWFANRFTDCLLITFFRPIFIFSLVPFLSNFNYILSVFFLFSIIVSSNVDSRCNSNLWIFLFVIMWDSSRYSPFRFHFSPCTEKLLCRVTLDEKEREREKEQIERKINESKKWEAKSYSSRFSQKQFSFAEKTFSLFSLFTMAVKIICKTTETTRKKLAQGKLFPTGHRKRAICTKWTNLLWSSAEFIPFWYGLSKFAFSFSQPFLVYAFNIKLF